MDRLWHCDLYRFIQFKRFSLRFIRLFVFVFNYPIPNFDTDHIGTSTDCLTSDRAANICKTPELNFLQLFGNSIRVFFIFQIWINNQRDMIICGHWMLRKHFVRIGSQCARTHAQQVTLPMIPSMQSVYSLSLFFLFHLSSLSHSLSVYIFFSDFVFVFYFAGE